MSLPQTQIRYTEDQYLAMERESEERHEYLDGQIYAMAGESPQHGDICTKTDYLVVAQDRPLIEHFARQENGQWVIAASVTELSGSVHIASVNCTLQLAEVCDRVKFPEEEEELDGE